VIIHCTMAAVKRSDKEPEDMSFCFNNCNSGNRNRAGRNTLCVQRFPNSEALDALGASGANDSQCRPAWRDSAYGSVYHSGTATLNVTVPGEIVAIPFTNDSLLNGVTHETGAAEVVVEEAGDYELRFALYFTATADAFATFAIQANEANLAGGVFSRLVTTEYQTYSGSTIASLDEGDRVRIVFTSSIALGIQLTGSDVTATLSIEKLSR